MVLDENGRVNAEATAEADDFRREQDRDAFSEEDKWVREGLAGMSRDKLEDFAAHLWHSRADLMAAVRRAIK